MGAITVAGVVNMLAVEELAFRIADSDRQTHSRTRNDV